MLKQSDPVVLNRALPKLGLEPGAQGVVVHVYGNGAGYEIEFLREDGSKIGVVTLMADDLDVDLWQCPPAP